MTTVLELDYNIVCLRNNINAPICGYSTSNNISSPLMDEKKINTNNLNLAFHLLASGFVCASSNINIV